MTHATLPAERHRNKWQGEKNIADTVNKYRNQLHAVNKKE
jgi:hypothetical protein